MHCFVDIIYLTHPWIYVIMKYQCIWYAGAQHNMNLVYIHYVGTRLICADQPMSLMVADALAPNRRQGISNHHADYPDYGVMNIKLHN